MKRELELWDSLKGDLTEFVYLLCIKAVSCREYKCNTTKPQLRTRSNIGKRGGTIKFKGEQKRAVHMLTPGIEGET